MEPVLSLSSFSIKRKNRNRTNAALSHTTIEIVHGICATDFRRSNFQLEKYFELKLNLIFYLNLSKCMLYYCFVNYNENTIQKKQ